MTNAEKRRRKIEGLQRKIDALEVAAQTTADDAERQKIEERIRRVWKQIADIERDAPTDHFHKAFDEASDLIPRIEALKAKLNEATTKPQRIRYVRKIRELNSRFARPTTRHHRLNRLVAQYAERHDGKVENIAALIRWLRDQGIAIVVDKSEGHGMTERAARIHFQKVFGIEGKPGRPRQT